MGFFKRGRYSVPLLGRAYVQMGIGLLHPSLAPANHVVDSSTYRAITAFNSCIRSPRAIYSGVFYSKLSSFNSRVGKIDDRTNSL